MLFGNAENLTHSLYQSCFGRIAHQRISERRNPRIFT